MGGTALLKTCKNLRILHVITKIVKVAGSKRMAVRRLVLGSVHCEPLSPLPPYIFRKILMPWVLKDEWSVYTGKVCTHFCVGGRTKG